MSEFDYGTLKKCIYTVITGGYDNLLQPKRPSEGFDYIVFSDKQIPNPGIWQVREIAPAESPVKTQREIKIRPHKYLHEYPLTIYVDANMAMMEDMCGLLSFFHGGMFTKLHPLRKNIFDEGRVVVEKHKDVGEVVEVQLEKYRDIGDHILYETGVIIRDDSDRTKELCEAWWKEVDAHSHRDQLSLPWAVKVTGIQPSTFGKTLFNRHIKIHPHVGIIHKGIKVVYSTPASSARNIGGAYNEFCSEVQGDDTWICLRDGDTMFLMDDWMRQIEEVIYRHGNTYELFGCVTNRLGSERQRPRPEVFNETNILKHYEIAKQLHDTKYSIVTPHQQDIAGMFMLFQKKTWEKNKFEENTIYCDTAFSTSIMKNGGRIGLMQGLYLFHYYRFHRSHPAKYVAHLTG